MSQLIFRTTYANLEGAKQSIDYRTYQFEIELIPNVKESNKQVEGQLVVVVELGEREVNKDEITLASIITNNLLAQILLTHRGATFGTLVLDQKVQQQYNDFSDLVGDLSIPPHTLDLKKATQKLASTGNLTLYKHANFHNDDVTKFILHYGILQELLSVSGNANQFLVDKVIYFYFSDKLTDLVWRESLHKAKQKNKQYESDFTWYRNQIAHLSPEKFEPYAFFYAKQQLFILVEVVSELIYKSANDIKKVIEDANKKYDQHLLEKKIKLP